MLTPLSTNKRMDPYLGCNFLVEIDGLLTGGFSQVQGLESTIEVEERREGGRLDYVHRLLKGTTSPNLVLSHGLAELDTLWRWYERTSRGVLQRKWGVIMLLDAQRIPVTWWSFREALPVKWVGPALDAGSDQVAVERLELVHRGLVRAPGQVGAARLAGALAR